MATGQGLHQGLGPGAESCSLSVLKRGNVKAELLLGAGGWVPNQPSLGRATKGWWCNCSQTLFSIVTMWEDGRRGFFQSSTVGRHGQAEVWPRDHTEPAPLAVSCCDGKSSAWSTPCPPSCSSPSFSTPGHWPACWVCQDGMFHALTPLKHTLLIREMKLFRFLLLALSCQKVGILIFVFLAAGNQIDALCS